MRRVNSNGFKVEVSERQQIGVNEALHSAVAAETARDARQHVEPFEEGSEQT